MDDIEQIVADMTSRSAPTMEDGNYCCVCDPYFLKDLRSDDKFLEISRYPGMAPIGSMTPGASSMAPPQINFNGAWAGGLMNMQSVDMAGQQTMPKNEIVSFRLKACAN